MDKETIKRELHTIFGDCEGNIIAAETAVCPEMAGLQMFEEPIVGFGAADDTLFVRYKEEGVIGPWHMTPCQWLPEAVTVISLFFPFTEKVRKDNRKSCDGPAPAWLHGRIEGQEYIAAYMKELSLWFTAQGVKNCVPAADDRFQKVMSGKGMAAYPDLDEHIFGSNWSERHAAYACGLGTFGLSKGIITRKGMAGRFGSIIIDAALEPDERPYKGIYDYCTKCGACVRRCPVNAISLDKGKDHNICGEWLNKTRELYAPRYGCGLCQTKVPCEERIPEKRQA